MFEIKNKIINHIQVNGNKFHCEKRVKLIFKNISKISKKNIINLIQTKLNYSCLIFQTALPNNKPYHFKNSTRIIFAVKQNLMLIKSHYKISNESLLNINNETFNSANLKSIENKLYYFYRWF